MSENWDRFVSLDNVNRLIAERDALLAKIEKAQPAIELAIEAVRQSDFYDLWYSIHENVVLHDIGKTYTDTITILEGLKDAKEEK